MVHQDNKLRQGEALWSDKCDEWHLNSWHAASRGTLIAIMADTSVSVLQSDPWKRSLAALAPADPESNAARWPGRLMRCVCLSTGLPQAEMTLGGLASVAHRKDGDA